MCSGIGGGLITPPSSLRREDPPRGTTRPVTILYEIFTSGTATSPRTCLPVQSPDAQSSLGEAHSSQLHANSTNRMAKQRTKRSVGAPVRPADDSDLEDFATSDEEEINAAMAAPLMGDVE